MVIAPAFITLENAISQIVQVFGFIRLARLIRERAHERLASVV